MVSVLFAALLAVAFVNCEADEKTCAAGASCPIEMDPEVGANLNLLQTNIHMQSVSHAEKMLTEGTRENAKIGVRELHVGVSVAMTSYPQVCGCEVLSKKFCNYGGGGDTGKGTCEACKEVPRQIAAGCDHIGLPAAGAADCRRWCFPPTPSPPTPSAPTPSAPKPSPPTKTGMKQVCGCEVLSKKFCNYDASSTGGTGPGTCEACKEVPAAESCGNLGLPAAGAADCRRWCFPSAPSPPTPSAPTPSSPTPEATSPSWKASPMKWIPNVKSDFLIQPCAQIKNADGGSLHAQVLQNLAAEKKTKCMQVFGVLVAGTAGADSNAMRYSANIIAQLLDPNCDGTVDEPKVLAKLDVFKDLDAGWMNHGTDSASESSNLLPGSFSGQTWKATENSEKPAILLEEAFHMVHQMGWAKTYPDIFGFKDYGSKGQSAICLCMKEAQCNWYQHPENSGCLDINGKKCYNPAIKDVFHKDTIPGTCASAISGDTGCEGPSCDCLEFFHKVETTWLGNQFNGYDRMGPKLQMYQSQGLTQREAVEKLLSSSTQCSRLLQYMKDSKLALPKKAIKETYQCGR